ncbi:MAG: hypothetical protein HYT29_01250 [Parcubacteria group bacterium]|nr:hypothetical protein [Parcubacteria group bacterium]
MEMVTFPWGDRKNTFEKRLEIICNLILRHKLPLREIIADAKKRARQDILANDSGGDALATCGCYNASPWPCSHRYCSCVPLFATTHTNVHRREYFTAALARLVEEKSGVPNTDINALLNEAKSAARIRTIKERWFERND